MPIRRCPVATSCHSCEAEIPAGELHRGPEVWADQDGPRWCWSCAIAGAGTCHARADPIVQVGDDSSTDAAERSHQERLLDAAARGARRAVEKDARAAEARKTRHGPAPAQEQPKLF